MSKTSHVFSNIFIISILALPAFYIVGTMVRIAIYNMITIHFNQYSTFLTIIGILLLIFHLIPPPPMKKKRIIFLEKLKMILKKFCRPESTEEIIFNDNIVQFAEYSHLKDSNSKNNDNNLKLKFSNDLFLEYFIKTYENNLLNCNINLQPSNKSNLLRQNVKMNSNILLNRKYSLKKFFSNSLLKFFFIKTSQKITYGEFKFIRGKNWDFQLNFHYFSLNLNNYNVIRVENDG